MKYPVHLLNLIDTLKKLPGVGNRSAERFAFELLEWPTEQLSQFSHIVKNIPTEIKHCSECGCLIGNEACHFCDASLRDHNTICVIASPKDAFSIEQTREFKGLYHVLGGLLSPLEGFGPDKLPLDSLKRRIQSHQTKELIIALDSTLEGDATALYLKQELDPLQLQISRIAFGLPMGSSLDYVDGGTLGRAFTGRRTF